MSPREQPEQQPPPVQRLRVKYAKRGRARFSSHRDFSRAFERALVRAGIPMAYSSGFNPHPRISYANAAPTGAASEGEYLEIGLAKQADPAAVREALDAALPPGLDIVDVAVAGPTSLADLLQASAWRVDLVAADPDALRRAVGEFSARDQVEVTRMTKGGLRSFDARAAVLSIAVSGEHQIDLVIRHETPLVRPDDVVRALQQLEPTLDSEQPPLLSRLRQGLLAGDEVTEPDLSS